MLTPPDILHVMSQLEQAPLRIRAACREVEPARLHVKPDPETWSANEILAHLRASADVWGKSIHTILAQDHPTIRYISPRTWIRKTYYTAQDFHASFDAYCTQRADLLALLNSLDEAGWARSAAVIQSAKRRELTVFDYARRMVMHEAVHCEQIEALLK